MKRIKLLIATLVVAMFGVFAFVPVTTVSALDPGNPLAEVCQGSTDSQACDNQDESAYDLIGKIVNVMLFIVGSLAVIMIIVAGILYVTSSGDSGKVSRAKNTLMYSIVGLVVSFLAYAIINWVLQIF